MQSNTLQVGMIVRRQGQFHRVVMFDQETVMTRRLIQYSPVRGWAGRHGPAWWEAEASEIFGQDPYQTHQRSQFISGFVEG